jgi:ferric-dicitrate binding protein FerR (iron transport regulator)
VQIGQPTTASDEGGSRLDGTVAEVVYLGMYTQFHVTTAAGRVVSNRLADESTVPLEPGSRVTLSWEAEHTSVLDDAMPSGTL